MENGSALAKCLVLCEHKHVRWVLDYKEGSMRGLLLVAVREITTMLRRPSFYVATLLMPILGATILFGFSLFSSDVGPEGAQDLLTPLSKPVGYVDQASIIETIPRDLHSFFIPYPDEAVAITAARNGTIDTYFLVSSDYRKSGRVVRVSRQASFTSVTAPDTRAFRTLLRINLSGDVLLAQRLDNPLNLQTEIVDDAGPPTAPADQVGSTGLGQATFGDGSSSALALLLAFSILSGGGWLMQAVAEEKENRTIEAVLTSLYPWQLMTGKLLGFGAISLLQLTVWSVIGDILLSSEGRFGLIRHGEVAPTTWVWMFFFFLLGFLFFGAILIAIGAVGASARESGQITAFLTLPVFVPFWFFSVIIRDPDGTFALVLSLMPFTAPVTMMLRLGQGNVPALHLLASITVMMLSVVGAIWIAARVFRASTLLTGARPSPRVLWRALREG
jgi:ABC-2 type transport system permease protein